MNVQMQVVQKPRHRKQILSRLELVASFDAYQRETLDCPISLEIVGMLLPPTGRIVRFRHVRRDLLHAKK